MGGKVQWEVEWADPEHWANGESLCNAEAALARRCQIEWDRFADHPLRLFGGKSEGQRAAIDLCACIADRLPRFGGEECRQLFTSLGDLRCSGAQDRATLPGAKRSHGSKSGDAPGGGALHLLWRGEVGRADQMTVKGRPNLDEVRRALPYACDEDLLWLHMGRV